MGDYALVFPTEKEWLAVKHHVDGLVVDVIGTMHDLVEKKTLLGKVVMFEGEPVMVSRPKAGWHVNVRGEMPDELKPYVVDVKKRHRVWA